MYRPVNLILTNAVAVKNWGTTITTPQVNAESAIVNVKTDFREPTNQQDITIVYHVLDLHSISLGVVGRTRPFSSGTPTFHFENTNPELWSPD